MKSTLSSAVGALALVMAGCATAQPAGPWSRGAFVGMLGDGSVRYEVSVQCSEARACHLTITKTAGASASTLTTATTALAPPLRALVPNHNLDSVRRSVGRDPSLFDDPAEGPLLAAIQDLLSGDETLTECFDLSTDASESLVLCNRSGDPAARRSVVLLMSTMKTTCSRGAFCAYYLLSLKRHPV